MKPVKVPTEKLKEIVVSRQTAHLAEARSQHAASKHELLLAETFAEIGTPIKGSVICLDCGTVRTGNRPCPECVDD